jgi:type I restriction enzyme, S subunit
VKLGELVDIIGGGTPNRKNESYWNGNINWITVKDFKSNYITSSEETITENGLKSSAAKLIPKGNVIIPTRMALGKVAINLIDVAINQDLKALIIKDSSILDTHYLFYYLKSKSNYIESRGKGATVKGITIDVISKMDIKLPNLSEQKKIVNILRTAQELIEKRKYQIEALDQLTQSVFLEMFGSIQGEKLPLSELCEINPPKREVADLKEDTIVSFIPMANVSENGEIDLSETRNLGEVYKGFTYFKENDVLFAKITPCMENGKGAIAKNLTNEVGFGSTEFHVLRPKEGITSEWLYYLTTLPKFRQQAEKNMTGSAGQKRVPKQFFDKYKVNKPTIESQEEFKKIILKINSQKEMLKKSLAILDTNFQSLMQRAFKGELFTEEKVSNL